MKKILTLALALAMSLSLAACGSSDSGASTSEVPAEETQTQQDPGTTEGTIFDDTTWSLAGGQLDGVEMEQADLDSVLEQYGGTLQFAFYSDGTAQLIQGGGTLDGTFESINDTSIGAIFDYNGSELRYGCTVSDVDGQTVMLATTDEVNYLYFVQAD